MFPCCPNCLSICPSTGKPEDKEYKPDSTIDNINNHKKDEEINLNLNLKNDTNNEDNRYADELNTIDIDTIDNADELNTIDIDTIDNADELKTIDNIDELDTIEIKLHKLKKTDFSRISNKNALGGGHGQIMFYI